MFKANRIGTPYQWLWGNFTTNAAPAPFTNNAMAVNNPVGNVISTTPLDNFSGRAIQWNGTQHIIPAGEHVNIIALCTARAPVGAGIIQGLEIVIQANIWTNGSNDVSPLFGEFDAETPPAPVAIWEAVPFVGYPLPIGPAVIPDNLDAAPGLRTLALKTQVISNRLSVDFGAVYGIGLKINNGTAVTTAIDALELGISVRQTNNQELQRYEDGLR